MRKTKNRRFVFFLTSSRWPADLASDQGNTGPEINPASIPDALLPQTHELDNAPNPPASHSEGGEGICLEEGGPTDADWWFLGHNAFEELAWDIPGLYQF